VFVEYEIWRAILKNEELHIGRMVADEFLKGYISTSRDVTIARSFVGNASPDGTRGQLSAVYALHSEGGFLLPPRTQHAHGTTGTEAEVAHPGSLPWTKVVGFRTFLTIDLNDDRTFQATKMLFMRKGFQARDKVGFEQVVAALGSLM
jgi:hypothetical protein